MSMENSVVYVEMFKLCNYKVNTDDIDVTLEFKNFLASRENQMWIDSKNRVWKYFLSQKFPNVDEKLHPFLKEFKTNNNNDFINLHVYYFICTYIGTQFYLIDILNHAENVIKFMKNTITIGDIENDILEKKNLLKFINLCMAKTDVIICFNKLQLEQSDLPEISTPNINIYNPKINIIENEEGDPDDFYIDDDINNSKRNELSLNNGDKFYFLDDMDISKVEANNKNVFIATEFLIKSGGKQYAQIKYPHASTYQNASHVVTFFLMISNEMADFEEVLYHSNSHEDAIYIYTESNTLFEQITLVLQKLNCHLIVENIVVSKNTLYIIFNDARFQKYSGSILDLEIETTFGQIK